MKQKYLIYALQDPVNFEIRYIGKSVSGLYRPKSHSRPGTLIRDKTYKGNWIRSLINKGLKPIIKVVQYLDITNPFELNKAEQYWISYFKSIGCPLTNASNGGLGRSGPLSEKTKQKMRGIKRSPEFCEKLRLANLGKKHSEESKKKMSLSRIGKTPWNKGKTRETPTNAIKVKDKNGNIFNSLTSAAKFYNFSISWAWKSLKNGKLERVI